MPASQSKESYSEVRKASCLGQWLGSWFPDMLGVKWYIRWLFSLLQTPFPLHTNWSYKDPQIDQSFWEWLMHSTDEKSRGGLSQLSKGRRVSGQSLIPLPSSSAFLIPTSACYSPSQCNLLLRDQATVRARDWHMKGSPYHPEAWHQLPGGHRPMVFGGKGWQWWASHGELPSGGSRKNFHGGSRKLGLSQVPDWDRERDPRIKYVRSREKALEMA